MNGTTKFAPLGSTGGLACCASESAGAGEGLGVSNVLDEETNLRSMKHRELQQLGGDCAVP